MTAGERRPLAGLRVLVTRPEARAGGLAAAIRQAGGEALICPTLRLEPVTPSEEGVARAAEAGVVVFVSPAAVEHGLDFLPRDGAERLTVGAVGAGTAAALAEKGWPCQLLPVHSSDSEGLLAHPDLAAAKVAGRRVVIVRGNGGRALLADTLTARGAAVEYLEVYARHRVAFDGALAAGADIVTVTSSEGLEALVQGVTDDQRARLLGRPLVTSGSRVSAAARKAGFQNRILTAAEPGNGGLLAAIIELAPTASGASGQV